MTVRTNTVTQSIAPEATRGTKPTSGASILQPNTISDVGAEVESVQRTPISRERMHEKGAPVGLTSKVTIDCDLTMHALDLVLPWAFFVQPNGPTDGRANGAPFRPTSVTAVAYVVPADGDIPENRLIRARGFAVAGNNGVKVVGAGSDADEIKTSGLAIETTTTAQGAIVEVCGVQGAAGDLEIDASKRLKSTALDFTTLGLNVGQWIHIGDSSNAAYMWGTSVPATDGSGSGVNYGKVRISAIAANLITFDRGHDAFVVDGDAGNTQTVRILFGNFIREVATDDADFDFTSLTVETEFPNLYTPDEGWVYQVGNSIDTCDLVVPLKSKGTIKVGAVGTDTEVPTDTQVAGWSDAYTPRKTTLMNTSSDVGMLCLRDSSGAILTSYWKSLTVSLKNNLSPANVLGVFGAYDINYGFRDITFEGQALLIDDALLAAVRENTTLGFQVCLQNDDGGFLWDIPSCTLSNGKPELPINEEVLQNLTGTAFKDATLGWQSSVSMFAYLPGD